MIGTMNSFDYRGKTIDDRIAEQPLLREARIRFTLKCVVPVYDFCTWMSKWPGPEFENNIMTKVEAVIQNSKLEAVKSALQEVGVEGMTVIEVRGHGRQKGHTEVYRGREYSVDLIPKTKLEMVLPDALAEKAVQAIVSTARTGKIGDGKIFLTRVDEAIRIRNDERGEGAL
jgi:nitrogen regulatory protein P-II 1